MCKGMLQDYLWQWMCGRRLQCSFFSLPVQMASLASTSEERAIKNAAEKTFRLLSMESFLFPFYKSFEVTAVRRRVSHFSTLGDFGLLHQPHLLQEAQRGLGPLSVSVPESWVLVLKQRVKRGPEQRRQIQHSRSSPGKVFKWRWLDAHVMSG